MPTKMVLAGPGHSIDRLETGTDATWRLVTLPELADSTGRFFDRTVEARAHPTAYQHDVRPRLWRLGIELTAAPPSWRTTSP